MRARILALLAGAIMIALSVASGCLRNIVRDPDRCNEEFLCENGRICYQYRCVTDLPDGADRDGIIMSDGMTVTCANSAACSDDVPICAAQTCRKCMGSGDDLECSKHDPQAPYCNAPSGKCVPCLVTAHCANPTPICDSSLTCRTCQTHVECPTRVCKSDGTCASPNEVATVNKEVACSDTMGNPYCQIQPALATGKPYIAVYGSTTSYQGVTLSASATTDLVVAIIGPGRAAVPPATVEGSSAPAVAVSSLVTRTTNVTLDGLHIIGSGGANKNAGVRCSPVAGTAIVTVKNCAIHDSGLSGVDSNACTLTLDANLIGPANAGGGVKLAMTPYTITNNIIFENGNSGRAVTMDDPSDGAFTFNTVALNQATAGIGGIECGAGGQKKIESSILLMNSGAMQAGPQCTLTNTVTSGTINFENGYRLKKNDTANKACCVDKITNPIAPNSNHDIDQTRRPQGNAHDIGAHEVE